MTRPPTIAITPTLRVLKREDSTFIQTVRRQNRNLQMLPEMLHSAEEDLASYESVIGELRHQIVALENRALVIKMHRDQIKETIQSPIRSIPVEVLSLILEHACRAWDLPAVASKSELPIILVPALILSSVCPWWRSLSLTTPRLWSFFSMGMPEEGDMSVEAISGYVDLLNTVLVRSGTAPLSFSFADVSEVFGIGGHIWERVLLPHASRWSNVTLSIWALAGWADVLATFEAHVQGRNFDAVESLKVRMHDRITDFRLPPRFPRLRSVRIDECEGKVDLPWEQLNVLSAKQVTELGSLRQATELRHLEGDLLQQDAFEETHLPNLFSLRIHFDSSDSFYPFQNMLTLPRLTSLSIQPDHLAFGADPIDLFLDTYKDFQLRSGCRLTELSLGLGRVQSDAQTLFNALRLLPSLERLTLEECNSPLRDETFQCALYNTHIHSLLPVSPTESHGVLLPELKELRISTPYAKFSDQAFVEMVRARWSPGEDQVVTCLSLVKLSLPARSFDRSQLDFLKLLEGAGLEVYISDESGTVI